MKPILFNTEMVRAILNGHKNVTRRPVKMPCTTTAETVDCVCMENVAAHFSWSWSESFAGFSVQAPYRPGDILYVRETWSPVYVRPTRYIFKADVDAGIGEGVALPLKWHPSIHMPREAARLFLRVTSVRVERLRDITEEEARAEGFPSKPKFIKVFLKMYPECTEESWVWVIEFERISKEEALKNA